MEKAFRGFSFVYLSICLESLVSSDPKVLHFLFVYQYSPKPRPARYCFCLCSSLRVDIGSMSIQKSVKRIKSNDNLPIHLTISMFPIITRLNRKNLQTREFEGAARLLPRSRSAGQNKEQVWSMISGSAAPCFLTAKTKTFLCFHDLRKGSLSIQESFKRFQEQ